jgi:hypothetical protein
MTPEKRSIAVIIPGGAKIVKGKQEFIVPKDQPINVNFYEGIALKTHPTTSNIFVLIKDNSAAVDLTIYNSKLPLVLKAGKNLDMKCPSGRITLDKDETFYLTDATEILIPAGTWLRSNGMFFQKADDTPMYLHVTYSSEDILHNLMKDLINQPIGN